MKRQYVIKHRDSGVRVTDSTHNTLADVQKELRSIKKLIGAGYTLYKNVEQFMSTDIVVYDKNSEREYRFEGTRRIS